MRMCTLVCLCVCVYACVHKNVHLGVCLCLCVCVCVERGEGKQRKCKNLLELNRAKPKLDFCPEKDIFLQKGIWLIVVPFEESFLIWHQVRQFDRYGSTFMSVSHNPNMGMVQTRSHQRWRGPTFVHIFSFQSTLMHRTSSTQTHSHRHTHSCTLKPPPAHFHAHTHKHSFRP